MTDANPQHGSAGPNAPHRRCRVLEDEQAEQRVCLLHVSAELLLLSLHVRVTSADFDRDGVVRHAGQVGHPCREVGTTSTVPWFVRGDARTEALERLTHSPLGFVYPSTRIFHDAG